MTIARATRPMFFIDESSNPFGSSSTIGVRRSEPMNSRSGTTIESTRSQIFSPLKASNIHAKASMRRNMKITAMSLLMTVLCFSASAQKGDAAIGIRATPDGAGLNAKIYMTDHFAFEGQMNAGGIVGLAGQSFTAVALLEGIIPLPDPSWRLFFGGGIHAGVWDNGRWYRAAGDEWVSGRAEPIFGIDGIGGVEYVFKKIPLSLSADVKPAVNFVSSARFFSHNMVGLSARYYFNR